MIIQSLLDLDFYKLTMAQFAYLYFPDVPVKFKFFNRHKAPLAKYIKPKTLADELTKAQNLSLNKQEIEYLERLGFRQNFINFLANLKLTAPQIKIANNDWQITAKGKWPQVTLWETIVLAIVNELYCQALLKQKNKQTVWQCGKKRLEHKIKILNRYPEIKIVEFGTRRRFSFEWQEKVVLALAQKASQNFLGTSNVCLAQKHNLQPFGTFAHEMDMVFAGIFRHNLKNSHQKMLKLWWNLYGEKLSIALTDTYGTDFFFSDFTREQALKWKGLRQDSGDPIEFGEKAIKFYQTLGIDPRKKIIIFSDGLDIAKIVKIYKHFKGRIQTVFGWGTNLTNDLGLKTLSIVMKAVEANGFKTVKLSDNLAKAIGDTNDIVLFKNIFGYQNSYYQKCRY